VAVERLGERQIICTSSQATFPNALFVTTEQKSQVAAQYWPNQLKPSLACIDID
jgi:hypothetical protein